MPTSHQENTMDTTSSNVTPLKGPPLPKGLRHLGSDRWIIQIMREGKPFTRRVRGTRADAERALTKAPLELGKRLEAATNSRRESKGRSLGGRQPAEVPTLMAFLSEGGRFENHQRRNQSERTQRKLVSPIRYLLASDLAPMRLDEITTSDVNDYTNWRLKVGQLTFTTTKGGNRRKARGTGASPPTINKSLRVLSTALRFAEKEGLITGRLPRIEMLSEANARPIHAPSEDELKEVLVAAEQLRPEAQWLPEVIELVIEFGFRPGELFSLTWESVDFEHKGNGKNKGCVYVEETLHVGNIVKERKRRLIPMAPRGREVLERLKVVAKAKTDFVVPNRHGLPYMRLDVPGMKGGGAGIWKRLQRATGVAVTLYALRHAFAEQSLMASVPLHVVSKWMGHSKVELTSKRYGNFAPDNASQWDWVGAREGRAVSG